MYKVRTTASFRKSYNIAKKMGYDLSRLKEIVKMLAAGAELPRKNRDHALKGRWKGCRECHIEPDWLLIYKLEDNTLTIILVETGTHSDLYKM